MLSNGRALTGITSDEAWIRAPLTIDIFSGARKSAIIDFVKVLIACVFGAVGLLALRSFLHDGFHKAITTATKDHAGECLSLAGSTTREENGRAYIVGSVRNRCDMKFSNVTVAFKIDRQESKVRLPGAPILAYAKDLKPGETREFKTQFPIDPKMTFRFDKISAF